MIEPIIIGAKVKLLTSKKKNGKKGDRGTVCNFDGHYVYVVLEKRCTTKREPQNVRYLWLRAASKIDRAQQCPHRTQRGHHGTHNITKTCPQQLKVAGQTGTVVTVAGETVREEAGAIAT